MGRVSPSLPPAITSIPTFTSVIWIWGAAHDPLGRRHPAVPPPDPPPLVPPEADAPPLEMPPLPLLPLLPPDVGAPPVDPPEPPAGSAPPLPAVVPAPPPPAVVPPPPLPPALDGSEPHALPRAARGKRQKAVAIGEFRCLVMFAS